MDILEALEATKANRLATAPDCCAVMPEIIQLAIDEIKRLRGTAGQSFTDIKKEIASGKTDPDQA